MPSLGEILDTGKKLALLSEEEAKKHGFETTSDGDDRGGCFIEAIKDATGRITIMRTSDWLGGDAVISSGPKLYIDDTEINMGALSPGNAAKLETKLQAAFAPLFVAVEKADADMRAAADAHMQAALKVLNHNAQNLIDSL